MSKDTLRFELRLFLCTALICLYGCGAPLDRRDQYLIAYQQGQFPLAEAMLTQEVEASMPEGDFRESPDAIWLLLDRATERFATGNVEAAIEDYRIAVEAIDYYNQYSLAESLGQLLLEDGYGAYAGEDFEQILARVYFAFALLHQGDESNAFALLRQAEEVQQWKREQYRKSEVTKDFELIDNALGKYLLALLSEKRKDSSNAGILYGQVQSLLNQEELPTPIKPLDNTPATLVIVSHNGNAPYKVSETSDASVASAVALELILQSQHIDPAFSSFAGIPVPALLQNPLSFPIPSFAIVDGQEKALFPLYDVRNAAAQQLHQQMPIIVARGVARFIIRRGAVACAQNRDEALGNIIDIAMLIANASTRADTRSWGMLPSSIDLARYGLLPGEHEIALKTASGISTYTIRLKPHDLCLIHLFAIHPGVITVQIPKRFLITKGESYDSAYDFNRKPLGSRLYSHLVPPHQNSPGYHSGQSIAKDGLALWSCRYSHPNIQSHLSANGQMACPNWL